MLSTRHFNMQDRFHLTFPHESIAEPTLCNVARQFDVTFSIRRADVSLEAGWMDLQLEGEHDEVERVIAHLQSKGVRVDPIEGDIIAG